MKHSHQLSFILFFTTALLTINCFAHYPYKGEINYAVPSCPPKKILLDGFYIGGQLGYDAYWVKQNISFPETLDLSGNPKINAPGWVGGLLAGYGRYFYEPYYLGIEVFANYSQANESYYITDTVGNYSSKISARGSWGIALLPGFGVTDTLLLYIRLGYNWGRFIANERGVLDTTSQTNTVAGPNYGLGMEALLVNGLSLRAEYTHTNYTTFNTSFGTNWDPSNNQIMVALIYHFVGSSCCC